MHFKLLTRLLLSCSFLSSSQHCDTKHNHSNKVAAIVVMLSNQTLQVDVETWMLYIKETVFGMQDGAQLINHTYPSGCLIALAAALLWQLLPHTTGILLQHLLRH
jgi:hypothetical protein